MTGKEALKLAQDTILANNGNNKSSFTMKNLYLVEKELERLEKLEQENKKLNEYLVKFDNDHFQHYLNCARAFHILKDKLHLRVIPCSIFEDETKKYLDYDGDYRKPMTILDNEEAELLEELMKGANDF